MTEREELQREITRMEKNLRKLKELAKGLESTDGRFQHYRREAAELTQHMDDWIDKDRGVWVDSVRPLDRSDRPAKNIPLSLLFLGPCSGTWAARSRVRGELPGFGGFLIVAEDPEAIEEQDRQMCILVDPGRGTFDSLLTQQIHPKALDMVIATHAHFDCVRDLELILMASCPTNLESPRHRGAKEIRLLADRSVLMGLPMDVDAVMQGKSEGQDETLKARLNEFPMMVPAALGTFDLFERLEGRFEHLEIDRKFRLRNNVDLYTRRSFHGVGYGPVGVPALDLVIRYQGHPVARCVYLADTEYRPDLADQYSAQLGPIHILVCNVKTLDFLSYPATHELAGYTRKHLGWKGLLQLTRDLRSRNLLDDHSVVVLRAWGIETVTSLDPDDSAMVARPEKLAVYEEQYQKETGQPAIVPGTTWAYLINATDQVKIRIDHKRRPYFGEGQPRPFGKIVYTSEAMGTVVAQARALTDQPDMLVVITGETGTGKDELAKAIHTESKRSGNLFIENASFLEKDLAVSQLFGYVEGAYTGAVRNSVGWLGRAENGTLIIQDFTNMSDEIQGKLLTVLEQRVYHRLGDNDTELPVEAQIILTTNEDLDDCRRTGRLRDDLFRRFDRELKMPPLRERREDIPVILDAWRDRGEITDHGNPIPEALDKVSDVLSDYSWPGNVRQLKKVVQRLAESGNWSEANIRRFAEADQTTLSPDDGDREVEELVPGSIGERIVVCLQTERLLSRRDFEDKFGITKPTLTRWLRRLVETGHIQRLGRGPSTVYRLINRPRK